MTLPAYPSNADGAPLLHGLRTDAFLLHAVSSLARESFVWISFAPEHSRLVPHLHPLIHAHHPSAASPLLLLFSTYAFKIPLILASSSCALALCRYVLAPPLASPHHSLHPLPHLPRQSPFGVLLASVCPTKYVVWKTSWQKRALQPGLLRGLSFDLMKAFEALAALCVYLQERSSACSV